MGQIASLALSLIAAAQVAGGDGGGTTIQEIQGRLASQKIEVEFENTPLNDALGVIRSHTGYNIILDPKSAAEHESKTVTLKLKNLSVKSILRIMLNNNDLTMVYRQGVLVVVPKSEVDKKVVTKVYDVRDLLYTIKSFPGPKVELVAPEATGGTALSGAIFEIDTSSEGTITEDFLTTLIPQSTGGKEGWSANENASITVVNNMLVVTQTEKVHAEVADLLRLLRQFK
jgi:hypothetical protein